MIAKRYPTMPHDGSEAAKKLAVEKPLADLEVFMTHQVARICHVSDRTVKNWIDRGTLAGYRLPAGLGQGDGPRRVERAVLVEFLKANGMPLGGLKEAQG